MIIFFIHNLGVEDEICPYATFHLLGFREEMDPTKALNFQTFPHQNGQHVGTMGPNGPMPHPGHMHSRAGSQSMVTFLKFNSHSSIIYPNFQPRANRFARKNSQGGQSSIYSPAPEYDDPANYAPEEDQYRRCNPYGMINYQNGNIFYCETLFQINQVADLCIAQSMTILLIVLLKKINIARLEICMVRI